MKPAVTIIIRSIGERTEAACRALACGQAPEENVVVIRERPFGEAVRKTFRVGLERGLPWTLALDADVLLCPNALRDMLACAERQPDDLFFANFEVADRLMGVARFAGVHLYRTAHLKEGLERAGQDIDAHPRPESLVRARMSVAGFLAVQYHRVLVGLHGFEQSYRDIYRTAFTHVLKHPADESAPSIAAWRRLADAHPDFRVAAAGAEAGKAKGGAAVIDDAAFPRSVRDIEALSGLDEKPPLAPDRLDGGEVARLLGEFCPFPERVEFNDMLAQSRKLLGQRPTVRDQARDGLRAVGVCRFPVLAAGSSLRALGSALVRLATK